MSEEQRPERKKKKKNLFEREMQILSESQAALASDDSEPGFYKEKLKVLVDFYEELLDQSKLITKVSDRLQKKITKANDDLEGKNNELQLTLDALTKAKLSRRASTITLLIFLALVLFSEAWFEPIIESAIHKGGGWWSENEFAIGLSLKVLLALSLRPIEKVIEKILMNQAQKREEDNLKSENVK